MTTIQDLRKQTGSAYDDLSDEQFAEGLWNKYQPDYQDFTKEEFFEKIGYLNEDSTLTKDILSKEEERPLRYSSWYSRTS